MATWVKIGFKYLEPLWTGEDGKISGKNVAALCLVYNFIENLNYAVQKWDAGRSLEGLSLIMGIEAGLITALWGLTAWSNMTAKKIDTAAMLPPNTTVVVEKAETVTSNMGNGKTSKRHTDITTRSTSDTPEVEHKPDISSKTE